MKYAVEHIIEYNKKRVRLWGMLPGNAEEIEADRRHPAVILLAGGRLAACTGYLPGAMSRAGS